MLQCWHDRSATEVEARQALEAQQDAPVISVENVQDAFCGFKDGQARQEFDRLLQEVLKPIPWCAECHPEGCAHYIDKDTLASGRIVPTRGTQEMFCKDFRVPPAYMCAG